jgi:uncharacterized protein (TIGR02145 family)
MKKTQLLCLFLLAFAFTLNAQEISFSFTANHTCEYSASDSVLIENLTQGGDTTLYFPDTVLTIVLTGIDPVAGEQNGFSVSQNYPNPFETKTDIDVFVPERDDFTLNVYDVSGRKVADYKGTHERGMQHFTFFAGNAKSYILTVSSGKYLQHIQMIQFGEAGSASPHIEHHGSTTTKEPEIKQKSLRSYFAYELGDEMRFTGFIDGDYEEIIDIPATSEDYVFSINDITPDAPDAISGSIEVCENASSKTYNISAVDGATGYNWTVPSGASITDGAGTTSITVDFGTISGEICVSANNVCGESATTCETILVSDPAASISGDTDICAGESTTLTASGGTSYEWNTGSTNASIDVSNAGDYIVTVTDDNGCTGIDNITVTVHPNPTADAGADDIICEGEDVVIGGSPTASGGSGSYTYAWSPSTGLSSTTVAEPSASPGSTETYTIIVTDANGCTASDNMTVTVSSAPSADAGSDETICEGGSVLIGGSPTASGGSGSGYSYIWSPSGTLSNAAVENPIATPVSTETYNVTVSDDNGCSASDAMTVIVSNPEASAMNDSPVCQGEDIQLDGSPSGMASYNWSGPDDFSSTEENPVINSVTTLAEGTYNLTVTDSYGCTGVASTTVTVYENPTANAGSDEIICEGASIGIGGSPTASGGSGSYTYAWSPSTGLSSTTVADPSASPGSTETYTVTVADANGCTASDNMTVTVSPAPIVDAGSDETICEGSNVEIGGSPTASGGSGSGYTYAWNPSTGLNNTTFENPIASPASTETYSVAVTDGNGCSATDEIIVTVNSPVASVSYNDPVCVGSDLLLDGGPSGMASYDWDGADGFSSSDEDPSIMDVTTAASGTYSLTVTDNYGCTSVTSTSITINDSPTAEAGSNETICIGETVGLGGSPTASGGSGSGYSYAWSPASGLSSTSDANPDATPDTTTTYTVTVTDGNGCTAFDTVQITVNDPNAEATSNSPVCGGDKIYLYGNPNGMDSYEWSGPAWNWWNSPTDQNTTVNNAGIGDEGWYELTVEDNNGCISTSSVYVIVSAGDPDAPAEGSHNNDTVSIEWNWHSVSNATGYKFNTTDNYNGATDNGADTSYIQTNLTCGTPYTLYVWAYDDCGGVSDYVELTAYTEACGPFECGDLFIDTRDGSGYQTIQIGSQCWMAENLNYDNNVNGNSWCYDDSPSNCGTYGRLYDWEAAMEGAAGSTSIPSGVQGICPDGWHIPSDEEWEKLEGEVDDTYNYGDDEWDINGYRGEDAGSALAGNASLWNDGALESHASFGNSGFVALPGGRKSSSGDFTGLGNYAYFWSSTEDNVFAGYAFYHGMHYDNVKTSRYNENGENGLNVRCVKD